MSEQSLDVLYLPDDLKLEFCLGLLEQAGAEKINVRESRGEIITCCVAPWHSESRPSASLNYTKMVYRCLSCGAKGGILYLIGLVQGLYGEEARAWLAGETGLGGTDFQVGPLLAFLDAVEAAQQRSGQPVPMPVYSAKVLEPWTGQVYPGLTTGVAELGIVGRGIPEDTLRAMHVGWDLENNVVIIPHFWAGDLVGWQARRIIEADHDATGTPTPKYKSTPDFPRDRTLYGALDQSRTVVVVESPMSRLRHQHHLPIRATFGSVITAQQIGLLKWYPEIIFWMDNDEAGWRSVEGYVDDQGAYVPGAAQTLAAFSTVKVVESDWHADPADLDEDTAADLVAGAVPLAIWTRPTGALRCLVCRERHGGPCDI